MAGLDQALCAVGHKYAEVTAVRRQCLELAKYYHSFRFSATPGGLCLQGTVPIIYRQRSYNIPIRISLPDSYPASSPTVALMPTVGMVMRQNHSHVDAAGRVYIKYLSCWSGSTSDLVELCRQLSQTFEDDPPLRAAPATPSRVSAGAAAETCAAVTSTKTGPSNSEDMAADVRSVEPREHARDLSAVRSPASPARWWQIWRWEWWQPREAAMVALQSSCSLVQQRQTYLQNNSDMEVARAKQHMRKKNRSAAIVCLKRKQMYDKEIANLENVRFSLEQEIMALDGAVANADVVRAMKVGADGLKQIQRNMTVDRVEDTMQEVRETVADAEDVSRAIAEPLDGIDVEDDLELERELADLERSVDAPDGSSKVSEPPSAPEAFTAAAATEKPQEGQPSKDGSAKRVAVAE
jgi:charged multivesicular body protein 4